MYQFEKMGKKLLGEQIEEELMDYILQEPVSVGEKIPNEFELASRFGVGRSTIREAVKGLVSKGILEVRRGDGTYVISTSTVMDDPLGLSKLQDKYTLALELLDVRLMLEPEIAARAAELADEKDRQELLALCNLTEQTYLEGKNHIQFDIDFHTCIAKCSKNRVVETLIPVINTAVMTFANLTHRMLKQETIDTHRAITDAILAHDSTGARCAMMMHLTYNRQALMKQYQEHKKKGNSSDNSSIS
ncbi:MAG: FadR/GntR family transcriptional regulator [Fusicatenibacter sp.]|nr:FadR/GntR family transcriptional regulator [Fusicatenibacter sp.]